MENRARSNALLPMEAHNVEPMRMTMRRKHEHLSIGAQRRADPNQDCGVSTFVQNYGCAMVQSPSILENPDAGLSALDLRLIDRLKARFAATREHTHDWIQQWTRAELTSLKARFPQHAAYAVNDTAHLTDIGILDHVYNSAGRVRDLAHNTNMIGIEPKCAPFAPFIDLRLDNEANAKGIT